MNAKALLLLAGGALAIAVATPAAAQSTDDLPFNGIYAGVSGGFDAQPNDIGEQISFDRNLDGRFGDTVTNAAGANAFSQGFCNGQARNSGIGGGCINDRDSYSFAGRVGYDRQYSNIVVGLVGEFGYTNIRDAVSAFSTTPASYTFNRKVKYTGNVRLRAGYAFDKSLFYATGGGVYAKVDNYFRTTNTANTFPSNGDTDAYGYTFGGGMEQKIGKNISIGVEYLNVQLRDDKYRVRATATTGPFAGNVDFRRNFDNFHWSSVRAVLNFRL